MADPLKRAGRFVRRIQGIAVSPGHAFGSPDRLHELRLVLLSDCKPEGRLHQAGRRPTQMRFPVALRYVDVHPRILPRRRKAVNFTMTVWIRFRLIDELRAVFDRQAEVAHPTHPSRDARAHGRSD